MKFFDTHCHLGGEELGPVAVALAKAAAEGGVGGLALIAADEFSLEQVEVKAREIKTELPSLDLVYTAGVHPHDSEKMSEELWKKVVNSAENGAAAIGETGLDYFYEHSDRQVQKEAFARHISLASRLRKPLVIHCRDAKEDLLGLLDVPEIKSHPNPGILHCFTEDLVVAKKLLDLNFYISFSGILSFKNAEPLRQVAAYVPSNRILIETDSPWLAPIPHRGKRNQPLYVKDVFSCLQSLLGTKAESLPEKLAETLYQNSCRVYGIRQN